MSQTPSPAGLSPESLFVKTVFYICVAVLLSLWFAYNTTAHLTANPLTADAKQNAITAYHLVHHGVWGYGEVDSVPPRPTMQREPLPILAISVLLLLHPNFAEPYSIADIVDGRLTRTVKLVNVFWRFLVAFFIFLLCLELFRGQVIAGVVALITLVVSDMTFLSIGPFVDRLYTELPAAALLLAASWCAVRFVQQETTSRATCLGIAMALLALTKAAFFYIGIVFILLLFLPERVKLVRQPDDQSLRRLRITYGVLVAVFFATLAPWVMRNTITNGKFAIVTRAEDVLGLRMLLTEQPPLGVIYFSSPSPLKKRLGPLFGYSAADLKVGGILDGITFAKQRRKEIYKSRMEAEGYRGNEQPWLRRAILSSIVEHPLRYFSSVGVFAYRGMWFMRPSPLMPRIDPLSFYAFSALSVMCFLGVFFGGLIASNKTLIAAFGLGGGAFLLHSALTHALTRYNAPLTPLVIISTLWLCVAVWGLLRRPREQVSVPEMSP
jgi:hypothetical protein